MIRIILSLFFITFFSAASAQQFLVFKNRKDSIHYAQTSELLWFRQPNSTENLAISSANVLTVKFDSLNTVLEQLRKKAIGWGQHYTPKRNFVSYADLKAGKVHPDSIKQLSISNLKSVEVPIEVLACKNLQELELVNTQIDIIPTALNTLTHLTSLYLFNNVPAKRLILEKNDHINYLRMAGHHPEKMPKTYKNFTSLDSLNINRSLASRIPNVKNNKELKIIHAIGNNISFKGNKKSLTLEKLDLRMNKVTKVPNSISRKYPNLKALSFNANPVKKVKPGLGKLRNLEYISFYGNMLSEIPAPVYKLTSLQVIDLFDNRIEAVSPEIKNLQQLKVLYLANNRLYSLPEEIGQLKNLEEVYVYNNRMDTLPASMDHLEKLRVLWVNDNFFHTIPATTWRVKNMDYLDASQNFIKQVPEEITEAKQLTVLILSGTLMNKERDNPELFQKLREKGTRIIYYRSDTDVQEDDSEF